MTVLGIASIIPLVGASAATLAVTVQGRRAPTFPQEAFRRETATAAVTRACTTLRHLHPEDGNSWFKQGFEKSVSLINRAVLYGGIASCLSLLSSGAGVKAVALGALFGLSLGVFVASCCLSVVVGVALCRRFYCRTQTRLVGAGEASLLRHLRDQLAALPNKDDREIAAVRDASDELWRLHPGNWLLQGACGSALPPLSVPLFLDLAPLWRGECPTWLGDAALQPAPA